MSILARAVEIASTLDPTLLLELEQDFGADFQDELQKSIENVEAGGSLEPSFESMKAQAFEITDIEYSETYSLKQLRAFATYLELRMVGAHLSLTRIIYKELGL